MKDCCSTRRTNDATSSPVSLTPLSYLSVERFHWIRALLVGRKMLSSRLKSLEQMPKRKTENEMKTIWEKCTFKIRQTLRKRKIKI